MGISYEDFHLTQTNDRSAHYPPPTASFRPLLSAKIADTFPPGKPTGNGHFQPLSDKAITREEWRQFPSRHATARNPDLNSSDGVMIADDESHGFGIDNDGTEKLIGEINSADSPQRQLSPSSVSESPNSFTHISTKPKRRRPSVSGSPMPYRGTGTSVPSSSVRQDKQAVGRLGHNGLSYSTHSLALSGSEFSARLSDAEGETANAMKARRVFMEWGPSDRQERRMPPTLCSLLADPDKDVSDARRSMTCKASPKSSQKTNRTRRRRHYRPTEENLCVRQATFADDFVHKHGNSTINTDNSYSNNINNVNQNTNSKHQPNSANYHPSESKLQLDMDPSNGTGLWIRKNSLVSGRADSALAAVGDQGNRIHSLLSDMPRRSSNTDYRNFFNARCEDEKTLASETKRRGLLPREQTLKSPSINMDVPMDHRKGSLNSCNVAGGGSNVRQSVIQMPLDSDSLSELEEGEVAQPAPITLAADAPELFCSGATWEESGHWLVIRNVPLWVDSKTLRSTIVNAVGVLPSALRLIRDPETRRSRGHAFVKMASVETALTLLELTLEFSGRSVTVRKWVPVTDQHHPKHHPLIPQQKPRASLGPKSRGRDREGNAREKKGDSSLLGDLSKDNGLAGATAQRSKKERLSTATRGRATTGVSARGDKNTTSVRDSLPGLVPLSRNGTSRARRGDLEAALLSTAVSSRRRREIDPQRVFIRNLSGETTEESLKSAFTHYGNILSSEVTKTSGSKVYGCVQFSSDADALRAVQQPERIIDGRSVWVTFAYRKDLNHQMGDRNSGDKKIGLTEGQTAKSRRSISRRKVGEQQGIFVSNNKNVKDQMMGSSSSSSSSSTCAAISAVGCLASRNVRVPTNFSINGSPISMNRDEFRNINLDNVDGSKNDHSNHESINSVYEDKAFGN